MTPQIDRLGKMSTVLRVSTHIYGVSKDIGGKTFIFQLNLGMWPLKSIVLEKQVLFWGFNTHLWGFSGDRWENVHFKSKPRHVTPQINHLRKMSPPSQSLTPSQQLYIAYSFTCYPALCVVIWSWAAGQVSHIFISSANVYQFTVVIVLLIAYCYCCVRCTTTTRTD